jgi:hypothetical protein
VDVDRRLDLLRAADHPAGDEVAQRARLRRRERVPAAIGVRAHVGAHVAAAAAPVVAPVAVQVGAERRLAALAPVARELGPRVVLAAVRVEVEDDVDLGLGDEVDDARVAARELVEQVERLFDRDVLARVLAGDEQHLGLELVDHHVVGDLHRPQLPALRRAADREAAHDVRMRRRDRRDLRGHRGVTVVSGERISVRRCAPQQAQQQDNRRARQGAAGSRREA